MTRSREDRCYRSVPGLQRHSIWHGCRSQPRENSNIITGKTVTRSAGKIRLWPPLSPLYLGNGRGSTLEQGSGWNPQGGLKWVTALLSAHIFMTPNDICATLCLLPKPRSLCKPGLWTRKPGSRRFFFWKCSDNIWVGQCFLFKIGHAVIMTKQIHCVYYRLVPRREMMGSLLTLEFAVFPGRWI